MPKRQRFYLKRIPMIVRKIRTRLKSNQKSIHNVSPLRGVKTPKLLPCVLKLNNER
jgi:hypothetical protein